MPSASQTVTLPSMAETHELTQAAYDRLKEEYEDLTTRGRVEIAHLIERAREMGDLSENGDYHAAKDDQGKMEARIRHLEAILEDAVIVEASADGAVRVGTIVELRYEGDDETEKYFVGSIEEKTGDVDVMSPKSPLGQALIGAKAGDTVSYEAPTGAQISVEIVAVEA